MKFTAACLLATSVFASEDHWAVLIAGSRGYWNYRHQSDVMHAHSVLKNNGFPEDQIIVMIYDDVAEDSENPFKGELYNNP